MTLSDRIILYDSQGSGQCPHWERNYYIKVSYFGGLRTGIASELTCCSSRCESLERQLCRLGGWSQTSWAVQQIGNSAQTAKCTEKWSPELSDQEPISSTKSNWSLVTWGKQVDQLQQSYNYHSVPWSQGFSGFSGLLGVYRHVTSTALLFSRFWSYENRSFTCIGHTAVVIYFQHTQETSQKPIGTRYEIFKARKQL